MSIRLLAKDLYRIQQEVDRLELELRRAPIERYAEVEGKLRRARAERERVRRILDGHKDAPAARPGQRPR